MRMNPDKRAFVPYLAIWLVLALAPAAWALLGHGGYEMLMRCFAR
jgi:hypothetical protein